MNHRTMQGKGVQVATVGRAEAEAATEQQRTEGEAALVAAQTEAAVTIEKTRVALTAEADARVERAEKALQEKVEREVEAVRQAAEVRAERDTYLEEVLFLKMLPALRGHVRIKCSNCLQSDVRAAVPLVFASLLNLRMAGMRP
jgi:hypothetical protein